MFRAGIVSLDFSSGFKDGFCPGLDLGVVLLLWLRLVPGGGLAWDVSVFPGGSVWGVGSPGVCVMQLVPVAGSRKYKLSEQPCTVSEGTERQRKISLVLFLVVAYINISNIYSWFLFCAFLQTWI